MFHILNCGVEIIYLVLHEGVFFRFKLFPRQVIHFPLMCQKKEIQFLSRLGLNSIKQLWCNANIQTSFSILFNLGESLFEEFCFSIYAIVLCWHKVFSIIAIIVPLRQSNIHIKLRDHQFACRLRRHKFK